MDGDVRLLLEQLCSEDESVFRGVFDHYKESFFAAAFKMTHSVTVAEEIVQDVFVTIWEKRHLIARADKPEGYVFTILHNSIYHYFRKLARDRDLKSKIVNEEREEITVETILIEKEGRERIENIITQLPPQQKLVYKMAKQEGLSKNEIADQLKISPNTVRNHLSAAIENLRSHFKHLASIIIWTIF